MKGKDLKVGMHVRVGGDNKYGSGDEAYILSDQVIWYARSGRRWATEYYPDVNVMGGRHRPKVAVAVKSSFRDYENDREIHIKWEPKIVTLSQLMPYEAWEAKIEAERLARIQDAEIKAAKEHKYEETVERLTRRLDGIYPEGHGYWTLNKESTRITLAVEDLEGLLSTAEWARDHIGA